MKTNDLKNVWKSEIDKNIHLHSDAELNKIIVNTARKSMKAIYPKGVFRIIIIAIIIYLIVNLLIRDSSPQIAYLDTAALVILSVSYFLWERAAFKMYKYHFNAPIKEWLSYRIKEVEKTIKERKKYDIAIFGGAYLIGAGFSVGYHVFSKPIINVYILSATMVLLLIFLLVIRYSINRNYTKTLRELKELYDQFEV